MSWLAWAAKTDYHRLSGVNIKHLFFTVLEAGSPRSGWQHGRVLGEDLPSLHGNFLAVSSHGGERESSGPFIPLQGMNPIMGAPTL